MKAWPETTNWVQNECVHGTKHKQQIFERRVDVHAYLVTDTSWTASDR